MMADSSRDDSGMVLEAAWATDVGRVRPGNEDAVAGTTPGDPAAAARGCLYLVADGMGGHNAGEIASAEAARRVYALYYADTDPDLHRLLDQAIRRANAELYELARSSPERAGMGTTLTAAVVHGARLYVAHVGDSRLYLVRGGKIEQVTNDHSWVGEQLRMGVLTPEQAAMHPQRNVITRALATAPDVVVDHFERELLPGDAVVICSDGLSTMVREARIAAAVTVPGSGAPAAAHSPAEAVASLIQAARDAGGPDNISVIVLWLRPTGTSATATYAAARPSAELEDTEPIPGPVAPGVEATTITPPAPGIQGVAVSPAATTRAAAGSGAARPARLVVAAVLAMLILLLAAVAAWAWASGRRGPAPSTPVPTPSAPAIPSPAAAVPTLAPPPAQPVALPGATLVAATVTLAPSHTPAPSATNTRPPAGKDTRAQPTMEPLSVFPTTAPGLLPATVPLAPSGDTTDQPRLRFRWQWSGQLGPQQGYALFVWRADDPAAAGKHGWDLRSAHDACRERLAEPAIETAVAIAGPGDYRWTVVMVDLARRSGNQCAIVSAETAPVRFFYAGRAPVEGPAAPLSTVSPEHTRPASSVLASPAPTAAPAPTALPPTTAPAPDPASRPAPPPPPPAARP